MDMSASVRLSMPPKNSVTLGPALFGCIVEGYAGRNSLVDVSRRRSSSGAAASHTRCETVWLSADLRVCHERREKGCKGKFEPHFEEKGVGGVTNERKPSR